MRKAVCWTLGMWALLQSLAFVAKLWAMATLPWWAVATLPLASVAVACVLFTVGSVVGLAVRLLYEADDCMEDCDDGDR